MELERLLMLLNLPKDADEDKLLDYLDEKIFDIKKEFLQPGFMFKKHYSKINQIEKLNQLQLHLKAQSKSKFESHHSWPELKGEIHDDYPELYHSKLQWNMLLQAENSPEKIKEMILDYEQQVENIASSWISSVNTDFIDEKSGLFIETKLNQIGDPTAIYKGFEKIKAEDLKVTNIFTKFGDDDEGKVLLKEIVKAYKFLKVIHGRRVK